MWSPTRGQSNAPHRPTLVSSILTALVSVGAVLGFVLLRSGADSAIPPTKPGATTLPNPIPTSPAAPTTVTTPATTASSSPGAGGAGTARGTACTPADVRITAVTNAAVYASGSPVAVTTQLEARRACLLSPTAVAPYQCPTTVVVTDALGHQVWPQSGQQEVCSSFPARVLRPGDTQSVHAIWSGRVAGPLNLVPAPPGTYQALATWAWRTGAGASPTEVVARSAPFAVS